MANNNDFSVVLTDEGQVHANPVRRQMDSPLAVGLEGLASTITTFKNSFDDREKARAKRAKDAKDAEDKAAGNELARGLLAKELGAGQGAPSPTGIVSGMQAMVKDQPPIVPDGMSFKDAFAPGFLGGEQTNVSPEQALAAHIENGDVDEATVEAISQDVNKGADTIRTTEAAVAQGVMPAIARETTIAEIVNSVLVKYPNVGADVIGAVLENFGVKNQLFEKTTQEFKGRDAIQQARTDSVSKAYSRGLAFLGPQVIGTISDAEITATGAKILRDEALLEQQLQMANIQSLTANTQKTTNEMADSEADKQITTANIDTLQSAMSPIINTFQKLELAQQGTGTSPIVEQRRGEALKLLTTTFNNTVSNQVLAISRVSGAQAGENYRKLAQEYFDSTVVKVFEEKDKNRIRIIQNLSSELKLDALSLGNTLVMLEAQGIKFDATELIVQNMNDDQRGALKRLISGSVSLNLGDAYQRDKSLLFVTEMLNVVRGDQRLNDVKSDPAAAAQIFRTFNAVQQNRATAIINGDISGAEQFSRGQMETIVVASDLTQASTSDRLANALHTVTGRGKTFHALDRLIKAGDEDAQLAGQGSRAVVGKLYQQLKLSGDMKAKESTVSADYYDVVYNQQTAAWETKLNTKLWGDSKRAIETSQRMQAGVMVGGRPMAVNPPRPSDAKLNLVSSLNYASSFLLRSAGWDVNTPKGTPKELADFYAIGKATPAMEKQNRDIVQGVKSKTVTKTGEAALVKGYDEFIGDLSTNGIQLDESPPGEATSFTGENGQKVTIKTPQEIRTNLASNPRLAEIEQGAKDVGIPPDLAITLIGGGENRSLDNNARAPTRAGGTAYGIMQIHDKDWDNTAKTQFGKLVKDLTPAENIKLGLWILKKNYQASGSWRDAISMYHSGRKFADLSATTSDGNVRTRHYVNAIMAASGMS